MTVTVADCERVQTSWFQLRSPEGGSYEDDGLTWANGDLMFPRVIDPAALARGVERARAEGASIVGAWLGLDVDAGPLAAAGFEKGWSPWWMAGPIDLGLPADPRVELEEPADEHAMALAWCATAREDGEAAGRAWSHLVGDLAGVFDVEVPEPFRRRGLGAGLMQAVCAAAASAGARHVVLNSTPAGYPLYRRCGLQRIGTGITWWLHLPA